MSHPAKLSLRAPPHLPFIQGWPGIPASPNRKPAGVHGTVELRIGAAPIKARWVRVEIRKYETLPSTVSSGVNNSWEHVGEIVNLWQVPQGKDWGVLETADFKFFLPLPEGIPPSVDLPKGGSIRYELVAALCYRQKGGLLKKESAPIMKISEPLRIAKHDLHSAWPAFNIPENKSITSPNNQLTLSVARPCTAFGPGDRILMTASLHSSSRQPFKLKGFDCTLIEVLRVIPQAPAPSANGKKKGKAAGPPLMKTQPIATSRTALNESLGMGGEKSARIEMVIPGDKLLVTVKNAKMLEIHYELEVKAVCEGIDGVTLGGLRYTVGPFGRANAQQAVRTPMSSRPTSLSSQGPPGSHPFISAQNPNRPNSIPPPRNEGFVPIGFRRKSSGSTTTATTTTHGDPTAPPERNFPNTQNQNRVLAFPVPNPAPRIVSSTGMIGDGFSRSTSGGPNGAVPGPSQGGYFDNNDRESLKYSQSDLGHGDQDRQRSNRYSTGTNATFGKWDKGLRSPVDDNDGLNTLSEGDDYSYDPQTPISPTPTTPTWRNTMPPRQAPSAWQTSEQEKTKLYDRARAEAIANQSAAGASLDQIGLVDDIPSFAPPEYAPPRPAPPALSNASRPSSIYSSNADRPLSTPPTSHLRSAPGSPLVSSSNNSPLPQLSPSSRNQRLFSAEEEKERLRYDAAINQREIREMGMARSENIAPGPSPSASGSGATSSRPTAPIIPVVDEKEQMRRFYEAQERVSRAAGQPSSPPPASSSSYHQRSESSSFSPMASGSSQPSASAGLGFGQIDSPRMDTGEGSGSGSGRYMSAEEEKEAMRRRYEEATSKVSRKASEGVSSAGGSRIVSSTPASPVPGPSNDRTSTYPSAEEEKETMRRRYEEATSKVSRNVSGGPGSPGIGSSGSGFTNGSPRNPTPGPSSAKLAYPSAEEEKEAMRRRYEEATTKVASRQVSGSGPSPLVASPIIDSRRQTSSSFSSPSKSIYPSAEEEKDLMRKRYEEATSGVAQASGSGSSSAGVGSRSMNHTHQARQPSLVTSPISSNFPSADEEKESMRRRYETATSKVAAAGSSSGTTNTFSQIQPSAASPTPKPSSSFMSADAEKDAMRRRYEEATSRVSSPLTSPTIGLGHGFPPQSSRNGSRDISASQAENNDARQPSLSSLPHINTSRQGSNSFHNPSSSLPASSIPQSFGAVYNDLIGISPEGSGSRSQQNEKKEDGGGNPPPIPKRPPVEYVRLLSPVQDRR